MEGIVICFYPAIIVKDYVNFYSWSIVIFNSWLIELFV